jgi:hypothetical protein
MAIGSNVPAILNSLRGFKVVIIASAFIACPSADSHNAGYQQTVLLSVLAPVDALAALA